MTRGPSDVVKSLKWILHNIEDCGPNTFEHAIHGYVGEAILWLEIFAKRSEAVDDYSPDVSGYVEHSTEKTVSGLTEEG